MPLGVGDGDAGFGCPWRLLGGEDYDRPPGLGSSHLWEAGFGRPPGLSSSHPWGADYGRPRCGFITIYPLSVAILAHGYITHLLHHNLFIAPFGSQWVFNVKAHRKFNRQ